MSRPFYGDVDRYVRELIMEQMGVGTEEPPQSIANGAPPTAPEAVDNLGREAGRGAWRDKA